MKYNQYSYIKTPYHSILTELNDLGIHLSENDSDKEQLRAFIEQISVLQVDKAYGLSLLIADWQTDALEFFQSDAPLTKSIFNCLALQLLEFIPHFDFTDGDAFAQKIQFPIHYQEGKLIENLYHLLNCRTKNGMILIDKLVSQGLIPVTNTHHYFNGKSLATFDTNQLIKEVVYVEAPIDTDGDNQADLIKVHILRPKSEKPLPVLMTASPYHVGVNEVASDKKLHKMEKPLSVKEAREISWTPLTFEAFPLTEKNLPESPAQESFSHIDSYRFNDYMLARGFASIYVSGVGTAGSTGFMTSGDPAQIASFKAVIDWLNGRTNAFTSHKKDKLTKAHWASGLVATTGISYLGTMSTALATTGVDGLKLIIAEAGISSWYDYYRENGLVCSPGGYPGEDLDSLAEFTYSRNLIAGEYLRHNQDYQDWLSDFSQKLDRENGDYNAFWDARNYLNKAHQITADVVYVHGLQDWNVKPKQVYQLFNRLPENIDKHLILHQGEHIYINNWQSFDFRESMNALLVQKLLEQDNQFLLPTILWQSNHQEQSWQTLDSFGKLGEKTISLGQGEKTIQNQYPEEIFTRYCKDFNAFKKDLFENKAQAISIDITLDKTLTVNGPIQFDLRLKSSTNKGLLSAQVLELGQKKQLASLAKPIAPNAIDNGRQFAREHLMELPYVVMPHRVITKGVMNLQNRTDLLTIDSILPEQWMSFSFTLQPTVYHLQEGDSLRILLYTTDFEHTIRDNSDYQLHIDLEQSQIRLPCEE